MTDGQRRLVKMAMDKVAVEGSLRDLNERLMDQRAEQNAAPLITRDAVLALLKETIALKRVTRVLALLTVAVLIVGIITLART